MKISSLLPLAALLAVGVLHAESVGVSGQLHLVPVGDAGHAADTTGYGRVFYEYRIGAYEVTNAQYAAFLNAVAATDLHALYNPDMGVDYINDGVTYYRASITRSGEPGSYTYAVNPGFENMPVSYVSLFDAARYANWLTNGGTASSSTETGMYALDGATSGAMTLFVRQRTDAGYAVAAENEWYKAAYYKGGSTNAGYWLYATQSNTPPAAALAPDSAPNLANYNAVGGYQLAVLTPVGSFTGSASAYGTYDQNGSLGELTNTSYSSLYAVCRDAGYTYTGPAFFVSSFRGSIEPAVERLDTGFRIVSLAATSSASPTPTPTPSANPAQKKIDAIKRQLKAAKKISDPGKRAAKIKKLKAKLKKLKKQL